MPGEGKNTVSDFSRVFLRDSFRGSFRASFYGKAAGLLFGCWTLMSLPAHSQTESLLWPNGAPGATDATAASKPSLTYFAADAAKANGTSVVICPGGGYGHLATDKEGNQVAKWLNTLGVAAFVLKYRLAPYHHPIEMNDGQRAMRWVKANARRYKLDPARVGILGFSAGGHLASTVATHYDDGNPAAADSVDRQSCKPWFQILVYPVITMEGPFAHGGSRLNLLGSNPSADVLRLLSNEKQVNARTPPAYLVHAKDDPDVFLENTVFYYDSLIKSGVHAQMKLYDHGPHGFGLANGVAGAPNIPEIATWPGFCATWMKDRGFLAPSTGLLPPPGSGRVSASGASDPSALGERASFRKGLLDFLGRWRKTASGR
jgi:acetyl esterase/lipase